MKQGSITVFFSMILLCLMSLFFSMAETVRVMQLHARAEVITQEALASAFSEYQPFLWEQYGLLCLDAGYGEETEGVAAVEERIAQFCRNNCVNDDGRAREDYFALCPNGCEVTEYAYLTDANGYLFRKEAVACAKKEMPAQLKDAWEGMAKETQKGEATSVAEKVKKAEEAIEEAKREAAEKKAQSGKGAATQQSSKNVSAVSTVGEAETTEAENPFSVFREIKKKGWLALVLQEETLSEKTMDITNTVSNRALQTGNRSFSEKNGESLTDKVYFAWYLTEKFSSYEKKRSDGALSYEVEYIIAGKESDKENLEGVVGALIGLREMENIATILASPSLLQQSYQVAIALAGASANPAVWKAVQTGVIAVWALIESILDVRTLLQGGKIPVCKTEKEWVSQITALGKYLTDDTKAGENETGITYGHYLAIMLLLISEREVGLRPLDLMEKSLNQKEETVDARMDRMLCEINVNCAFDGKPLFFSLTEAEGFRWEWYIIERQKEISYL